ncbi:hypothetical protein B0I37DRAFT_418207 [Chaetomium sp. MPI-CAGE-AT-0009]|nr:hypothetical protein B0I37DRAFT_418207 [Chaetomium sp. MPI-CAGE-AT-0009]
MYRPASYPKSRKSKSSTVNPFIKYTYLNGHETLYIYKEFEQPYHVPRDAEVLDQELRNLELFRGSNASIVQLIAAVISQNPYQTTQTGKESNPDALRGVLRIPPQRHARNHDRIPKS